MENENSSFQLNHPIYGIIIPLEDEGLYLKDIISQSMNISIAGINYTLGKISDKNIVLVNSGLGKVNSALIASRLIRDFSPDLILLSGSTGSINPTLKIGDVVIGRTVTDADFGKLTSAGIEFKYSQYLYNPQSKNTLPLEFKLDTRLVELTSQLNNAQLIKIILGKIATSDAIPNESSQIKLLHEGKFDVIDMEGSAVMQTCWLFNTPCVVVRGVSNNAADELITQENIKLASNNAAKVLVDIISRY